MSEAKISSKILRLWPVNTTCKVEIDKNLCSKSGGSFCAERSVLPLLMEK